MEPFCMWGLLWPHQSHSREVGTGFSLSLKVTFPERPFLFNHPNQSSLWWGFEGMGSLWELVIVLLSTFFFFVVLEIEPKFLYMLGKCSATAIVLAPNHSVMNCEWSKDAQITLALHFKAEHPINLKGFVFLFNEALHRFSFFYKFALKAMTGLVRWEAWVYRDKKRTHHNLINLKRMLQLDFF
jgi:hypothetical protein